MNRVVEEKKTTRLAAGTAFAVATAVFQRYCQSR